MVESDPSEPPTGGPVVERVIGKDVLAAVALRAAAGTPGVVRVEPGLAGLVGSWRRAARHYARDIDAADTAGVSVRVDPGSGAARIGVDVVVSGQDQAAAVGRAVQRSVRRVVHEATGVPVSSVSVSIVDIELQAGRG